jgi:hypothetical protein
MRTFLKLRRSYKNLVSIYNNSFTKRKLTYKILRKQTCDLKFPIFLSKLVPFKLRGVVVRRHKRTLNSSVTVGAYVSNVKLHITFPIAYTIVKIN